MSILLTPSETQEEKWEQQLYQVSMQLWETSTHVSPQLQVSEGCLMHTQAETWLSSVWQTLGVALCAARWQREVSGSAAGWDWSHSLRGCRVKSHESWPKSFRWLAFPTGPFLLLEDRSLDGWIVEQIEGHSRKSSTISFPICHVSAASASVSFPNLFWSVLKLFFFFHRVSPISACFNQCKLRLGRFSDRAVGI